MPNGDIGQLIKLAILVPFAFLVPLAILVGRYAVKRQRRQYLRNVLNTLEAASNTKVELIPTFEYALHKYDIGQRRSWLSALVEFAYFSTTAFIFALVGAAGFAFTLLFATTLQADDHNVWTGAQLFLFSGFSGEATAAYAKLSAGALTLAFLGSYIWSINYLIGRVANFDLSPVSFLRVTARIILACVVALAIRHVVPAEGAAASAGGIAADALVLLLAFLAGTFPDAGMNYLIGKVPALHVKRLDPEAAEAMRQLPVEMIDGVTTQVAFRLAEREVLDVQNLATENPILLSAETPYTPLECLDWIAQAQLASELGPRAYRALRDIGVHSILALEGAAGGELEQPALAAIYGTAGSRPATLKPLLDSLEANLHVQRLRQVHRVLSKVYAADLLPPARAAVEATGKVIDLQPPAA